MATVNGITVARAQRIEDASVVSGRIESSNGNLYLMRGDGSEFSAGVVVDSASIAVHAALATTHQVTGTIVGTGGTQTLSGKTLVTPIIASHVNAQHTHNGAAGGGSVNLAASGVTGKSLLHFGSAFVTPAAGGKAVIAHGAPFGTPDQVLAMACDTDSVVQARSGIVCNVLSDTIGSVNFDVRLYRNDTAASHESGTRINYICFKT